MVAVTATHANPGALIDAIIAVQAADATVAPRSRRWLERAVGKGLVLAAHVDGELAGWALSEPCTRTTTELGGLYVVPAHRDGLVVRELTRAGLALTPRSVVVTMDGRFARWLLADWGFRETTLGGMVRASRGMFLVRRLAPWRLRAAVGHVRAAQPRYLVRDPDPALESRLSNQALPNQALPNQAHTLQEGAGS